MAEFKNKEIALDKIEKLKKDYNIPDEVIEDLFKHEQYIVKGSILCVYGDENHLGESDISSKLMCKIATLMEKGVGSKNPDTMFFYTDMFNSMEKTHLSKDSYKNCVAIKNRLLFHLNFYKLHIPIIDLGCFSPEELEWINEYNNCVLKIHELHERIWGVTNFDALDDYPAKLQCLTFKAIDNLERVMSKGEERKNNRSNSREEKIRFMMKIHKIPEGYLQEGEFYENIDDLYNAKFFSNT
jgi:hypothetical protein